MSRLRRIRQQSNTRAVVRLTLARYRDQVWRWRARRLAEWFLFKHRGYTWGSRMDTEVDYVFAGLLHWSHAPYGSTSPWSFIKAAIGVSWA